MRFEGTLVQWNDDRGFGFVQPAQGGHNLFVHVSAFPRDGRRPQLHERLSFGVAPGQNGKKQAVAVQRPEAAGGAPSRPPLDTPRRQQISTSSSSGSGRLVALLLVCALVAAGYWKYDQTRLQRAQAASLAQQPGAVPRSLSAPAAPVASPYRCDGRQHCSQMTSCAEAQFFLKNCPDPRMDGNHDGVPCEQQWCTSPWAN